MVTRYSGAAAEVGVLGGGVKTGAIDGKIYCSSRTGEFTVIKASPKYELLGRSQLGEPTHATPAVSNGRMFLRGFAKLYCLEAK